MLSYITIPKSEYEALLLEVKKGIELCDSVKLLRRSLIGLGRRIPVSEDELAQEAKNVYEACDKVAKLRVELSEFERHLRLFNQELTPVRPPSRTDIQAAFENSSDFLQGKKKPPGSSTPPL